MTEEKLLEMWQSVTGYVEDWETKFEEILEELDSLSLVVSEERSDEELDSYFEDEHTSIETLRDEVKEMRRNLREIVKMALEGKVSPIDVEEQFRVVGNFLLRMEDEIMRMREEADERMYMDDYYYDEEEEE